MTDSEFFNIIKPMVIADMEYSGILASLTAAQAFLESNHGDSKLSQSPNNNLFGMKGEFQGSYVLMNTKEFVNGAYHVVKAKFRKYPSWYESITDHSDLFNRMSRYKNLRGLKDYKLACQYVQQDGYATSPVYASSLIRIIEKYKLYEWDGEQTITDPALLEAIETFAEYVIKGKFGQGHETRMNNIYSLIRKRVNDILK